MSELQNEQLASHILKTVTNWQVEDVVQWLTLNNIEVNAQKMLEDGIDGKRLITLTPQYWIKTMNISLFVAKRIHEWIQQQSSQFNRIVQIKLGILSDHSFSSNSLSDFDSESDKQYFTEIPQTKKPNQEHKHKVNNFMLQKQNNAGNSEKVQREQERKSSPIKKWQKNQFEESPIDKDNPHVKFISTQFVSLSQKHFLPSIVYDKKLIVKNQKNQTIITGNSKIGRLKCNEVCLSDESVSRNHAEIIKEKIKCEADPVKYYIRDVKSRFGTFVQFFEPYSVQENQVFQMGGFEFVFLSIKISSASPQNKIATFSVKMKIQSVKESFLKFQNRTEIMIGRKNHEIRLNSPGVQNNHARIFIQQNKNCIPKVFIEPLDGKVLKKLNSNELWPLSSQSSVSILFGSLNAEITTQVFCLNCGNLKTCSCIKYNN